MNGVTVQAWIRPEYRTRPDREYELVETEFSDFAAFLQAMAEDTVIPCNILIAGRGVEAGERIIHNRISTVLRGSAVMRAQIPTWHFVEAAG
ncbi:hypothetical protein [Aliiruegeria sabulilitoris]|uniref:hypothetical protein n=1 Tax=Aliiruegeria sabulilitoris TaxID=1510458 RepID=UPI00082FFA40|nr:hypothetical protein [Aliiruegeria sabulilitoris]NDR55693.1 hypothetical protein [Pseudoruegeria sp. M32A2M]